MFALYSVIVTTIMGIFVIAVLAMGMINGRAILIAAAAGLVLSVPVTWLIARNITSGKA
jgi:hypothetical protein